MIRRLGLALPGLLLASLLFSVHATETTPARKPVRIGTISTLFRDVPDAIARAVTQPFAQFLEAQTGCVGEVVTIATADELGRQLSENQVQLAVFHGFEFAWAKQKYPELQPLVIAINQQRNLHACLVVRQDCAVSGFGDLHSKSLALPRGSREHSRLFLHRGCQACGRETVSHLARMTTPASIEEALEDVVDGSVQATVVDGVALDCYKRLKPGRYARLRVVQESEIFPAAVIAYRPGSLDAATVKRCRDGLLAAHQQPLGRQLMLMMRLTAFEPVPADYDKTVANIARVYPPPASK